MITKKRFFKVLELTAANTEYSITLPKYLTDITIQCRTGHSLRVHNMPLKVAAGGASDEYWTIKANTIDYDIGTTIVTDTLYFASGQAGAIVEIRGIKQLNDHGKE